MRIFTNAELERRRFYHNRSKKWGAWLAASFMRIYCSFDDSRRHPTEFREDATAQLAKMGIAKFDEMCKFDKKVASMIYGSWGSYLIEMCDCLGEDVRVHIDKMV